MDEMTGTGTETGSAEEAPAQEELPAPPPVDIGGWPTWVRRTVIAVVLLGALGFAVWASNSAGSGTSNQEVSGAIVSLTPPDGAQALRQTEVGAELAVGYDGRLTVNGIAIPEDQMVGARDPKTVDPADLAKNGVRPNNRNSVYFKPGPGKVIEEFEHGTVTIQMKYFKDGRQATTANTVTWTIRVD
ncbi:hypothetical protein [Aquihabitans sp. McL0605]|uniref:hypothetical protein n=1 Tax=Aquihabitans sp. McL0605 TaxID=3415671 RepID=UPI003CF90A85